MGPQACESAEEGNQEAVSLSIRCPPRQGDVPTIARVRWPQGGKRKNLSKERFWHTKQTLGKIQKYNLEKQ